MDPFNQSSMNNSQSTSGPFKLNSGVNNTQPLPFSSTVFTNNMKPTINTNQAPNSVLNNPFKQSEPAKISSNLGSSSNIISGGIINTGLPFGSFNPTQSTSIQPALSSNTSPFVLSSNLTQDKSPFGTNENNQSVNNQLKTQLYVNSNQTNINTSAPQLQQVNKDQPNILKSVNQLGTSTLTPQLSLGNQISNSSLPVSTNNFLNTITGAPLKDSNLGSYNIAKPNSEKDNTSKSNQLTLPDSAAKSENSMTIQFGKNQTASTLTSNPLALPVKQSDDNKTNTTKAIGIISNQTATTLQPIKPKENSATGVNPPLISNLSSNKDLIAQPKEEPLYSKDGNSFLLENDKNIICNMSCSELFTRWQRILTLQGKRFQEECSNLSSFEKEFYEKSKQIKKIHDINHSLNQEANEFGVQYDNLDKQNSLLIAQLEHEIFTIKKENPELAAFGRANIGNGEYDTYLSLFHNGEVLDYIQKNLEETDKILMQYLSHEFNLNNVKQNYEHSSGLSDSSTYFNDLNQKLNSLYFDMRNVSQFYNTLSSSNEELLKSIKEISSVRRNFK